ncbi:MAG: ATP-NAD kinase family protein [Hadesarchaea archaeon]|nr:ATP-NAD kinase family protein [Hadesarchaea archaeon]
MSKLALLVNPIAGMGGRVGLKGTDGSEALEKARSLGADPIAPKRAVKSLKVLCELKEDFELVTYPRYMGEKEAIEAGFNPKVLGELGSSETTPEDTKRASKSFLKENVDLLLFAGGDGTARDIMKVVGSELPIIGIPTGVKMHSAVFANTPEDAGRLTAKFLSEDLPLRDAEVMDVNEQAFRRDEIETELMGYVKTPYEPHLVQPGKVPTAPTGNEKRDKKSIARFIVSVMSEDQIYIIGPGTTTRAIEEELEIENPTTLGVDLIKNREIIAKDVREEEILQTINDQPATIIVSPIGKQGFILGRGNQQISPKVIRKIGKEKIIVIATPTKIESTPKLKVDTGDKELDEEFQGHIPIIVGFGLKRMLPID